MKTIIPVAGMGAKLRPHTHTQPKTLVPIAGKPILAHIMDTLIEAGMKDFVLIVGYLGDKIEDFVRQKYADRIHVEFVVQEPREGSAHALWVAREQLQDEQEILVVFGDTVATLNLQHFLDEPYTVVGVKKVSNPMKFGIAELDAKQEFVTRLVEKPKIPKSNLALVGVYKIRHLDLLWQCIEEMIQQEDARSGTEYHLTDALMRMVQAGESIKVQPVDNWFDCGKKETLLEANAILLNSLSYTQAHTYHFPQTIIIPPVSIGKGCKIENSIIGPNVAIGDNTILKNALVSNSIIGSYSELYDVVLRESIIGNDSALRGFVQSLNIGDNTEINLSQIGS